MEESELYQIVAKEMSALVKISTGYIDSDISAHKIETGLMKQLLHLGYVLLSYIFRNRILKASNRGIEKAEGEIIQSKGVRERNYVSYFGEMLLSRESYWSKEKGTFYKGDEDLLLPKGSKYSYNIQELLGSSASSMDYRESVKVLNKVLDLGLSEKQSERNVGHLGEQVASYYEQKDPVVVSKTEGQLVCYSGSFDGKGVVMIKESVQGEGENPKKRLGKGEKPNRMQMATLSVTSSFIPKARSRDSILKGLLGSPLDSVKEKHIKKDAHKLGEENDNKWHKNIHKRAFLGEQGKAVDYGIKEIKSMMTDTDSRFVIPIDAGIGLEEKVLQSVKKYGMEAQFDGIILDIIHVSEYTWDAATAIFGEKSKQRLAWVRSMLEDILDSKTAKVISGLEKIAQKMPLSDSKLTQLNKTITYFTNHQHNMDYKKFIDKGYPVSSALVEAACGHLVKQRLEQSGMRWSPNGAQAMMDLRAVKLNDDMNDFMDFIVNEDRAKNFKFAA
jgi:hypothetical protein